VGNRAVRIGNKKKKNGGTAGAKEGLVPVGIFILPRCSEDEEDMETIITA